MTPDVVLLSEYVEGPDHCRFVTEMAGNGLPHHSFSTRVQGQNQTAIFSRIPQAAGVKLATELDPSIAPNFLHSRIGGAGYISFRMPAFKTVFRGLKRATWKLLDATLEALNSESTVIGGDFNSAIEDDDEFGCGDCLRALAHKGWIHARPESGFSWKHARSRRERAIVHVFASPGFRVVRSVYSWDFLERVPETKMGIAGHRDHALVVVDLEPVWTGAVGCGDRRDALGIGGEGG
jgi:hypothetical protein